MSKKGGRGSSAVAASKKPSKKHGKKASGLTTDDYDQVDHFHAKKDQIMLEEHDSDGDGSEEAEFDTILDLPDQEDVDDDEEYFINDVEDDEESRDPDQDWGKGRKNYYSADVGKTSEEAREGERLYKKKLSGMSAKDYGVSLDGGSTITVADAGKKVVVKTVTFSDSENDEEPATRAEDIELGEVEKDLAKALIEVNQVLKPLIEKVSSGSLPRSEGLSFLQTKYNLLLHYCINAVYYVKMKAQGKPISKDDLVIERLVKYRTLIEKTKPLEAKLKHQIDRLMKAALESEADAGTGELRARPELIKEDGLVDGEHDDGAVDGVTDKYRPPRAMQTEMFDERKKSADSSTRHSRIQQELLREHLAEQDQDAPEQDDIDPVKRVGKSGARSALTGTTDTLDTVEEDNFVRFQLSKKEKRKLQEQSRIVDGLDDLNDMFDEFDRRRTGGTQGGSEDEADLVVKQPKGSKKQRREAESDEIDSDIASDPGEYYEKVKQSKKQKSTEPASKKKHVHFKDIVDHSPALPRPASKSILSNRGLTPSRSKDTKNPRVKQRVRFEKASKRLGSFKAVHRAERGAYKGEETGIKAHLSRSTKFH
jgi:U3 small nucleolar RNA-associated protein 3